MNQPSTRKYPKLALAALFAASGGTVHSSYAALTELASSPLATSTSGTTVKPNIMFILDASGSMNADYIPDPVNPTGELGASASASFNCRNDSSGNNACARGDPPYYADKFNGLAYNPQFTYKAGVDFDGTSLGNQASPWTSVPVDRYDPSKNTINLITSFPEVGYCAVSGCANPRRNGIHNGTRFAYATPPKPAIATAITFSRSARTLTSTTNPGAQVQKGDVIDVIDAANPNGCIHRGVTVTVATATSFSYDYGDANAPACSPANVSFATVGYPEVTNPVDPAFRRNSFQTSSVTKPVATNAAVTVTFFNHGLVSGDVIDVTGDTTCATGTGGATVGAVTQETFTYASGKPNGQCATSLYTITRRLVNIRKSLSGTPFYFTLSPVEYCSDLHLTTCISATQPTGPYTFPAYVRYCKAGEAAKPPSIDPAKGPVCVDKFFAPSFLYPRYGLFTRGDIASTLASVSPDRPRRIDCVNAPNCTFTEEMTNFANWYAYYRRRIQAMKTSAGLSFLNMDDRYRVGFILIRPSTPVVSANLGNCTNGDGEFVPVNTFDAAQKKLFYCTFYGQKPSGGTPLRSALARVGRYYANKTDGINAGMTVDPVQYSCQQNFSILTTDGYWKGAGDAPGLDGRTQVGNQDGTLSPPLVTRESGTFDGGCPAGDPETTGGCANTLADVAMYYYRTDLRDASLGNATGALGADVATNNVTTNNVDKASWQHMVTFTIGLADGLMTWQRDYQTASDGDFKNITSGAANCFWAPGQPCNWPTPAADTPTALDDLWHAAVNGRGIYFHASDPGSLVGGLNGALLGVTTLTGASSAAATSSPNLTQDENLVFTTNYSTGDWSGTLHAFRVDVATGTIPANPIWKGEDQLDTMNPAQRDIRTFDSTAGDKLKPFTYARLTADEKQAVDNLCLAPAKLSQCANLTAADQSTLNNGNTIVEFLRGSKNNLGTLLRDRKHVLGDTVNATPAFVHVPPFNFGDAVVPSYSTFKNDNAKRQGMLYVGANDGMLHAFNTDVGNEVWAYVPRMLIKRLYLLADVNYVHNHAFFVDGSPIFMDAFFGGSWHTVLVGGLNAGGRGFYALDVTNPAAPRALWEFCNDPNLCSRFDEDVGFSYGNPIVTKRNGEWVVLLTSGYNNLSSGPGSGKEFLYVLRLSTGELIEKIPTNAGTPDTPGGLAKIAAFADNFQLDNTTKFVYGGDLLGNFWRFNLTTSPAGVLALGTLTDANGRPQPVTTRPELGVIKGFPVVFIGTGRFLGLTDLTDPASLRPPQSGAYQQTLYAFKDTGAPLGNLRTSGNLVQQVLSARDATTRTATNNPVDWTTKNGWFVDFNPGNASPGERVVLDPLLTLGTLTLFSTVPSPDACSTGGDSWLYQFSYDTGTYVPTSIAQTVGRMVPKNPIEGFVIVRLPAGNLKVIATDAIGRNPIFDVPLSKGQQVGRRIGWREITR